VNALDKMFKRKFGKNLSKRQLDRVKKIHLDHYSHTADSDGSLSESNSVVEEVEQPCCSMGHAVENQSDSDVSEADSETSLESEIEAELETIDMEAKTSEEQHPDNMKSAGQLFKAELANWATSHNVNHSSLDSLLTLLRRNGHDTLPKTARTLLKTPKFTVVKQVPPGEYVHFGLENCIIDHLRMLLPEDLPKKIDILVNVDGVPIGRTGGQLWPILGSFYGKDKGTPFVIGMYYGKKKPLDSNLYLADFLNETIRLTTNGMVFGDLKIPFRLIGLICDAPARSFIAGIKGHSGYYGCGKCVQEGEYLKDRVCFPENDAHLRTDLSFANRSQEEHHVTNSDLEKIPGFGMVSQIAFEYMHLVNLGAMRKLLRLWMSSRNLAVRLRSSKIDLLCERLVELRKHTCIEFARKPQSVRELASWKATELRLTLMYIGPHVFENILSEKFYQHFLCLHVAMRILACRELCVTRNAYAKSLMRHFVTVFELLYGRHLISYNIHGLVHLPDDVLQFGPVDDFSGFEFENHLQTVKKLIRKGDRPLQQAANRLHEKQAALKISPNNKTKTSNIDLGNPICIGRHLNGPLTNGASNPQYESIKLRGFTYSSKLTDNCCILKSGIIVVVKNVATFEGGLHIIGNRFKTKENAYTVPCESSVVGTFLARSLSTSLRNWPISDIHSKAMLIPKDDGSFFVVSLLHGMQK
jgi:hypothetical protein